MIENPSEKDEIYLANVAKIGDSVNNIQYMQDVLPAEEHKAILDYVKSVESWNDEPWLVKTVRSHEMPNEIKNLLEKVFTVVYQKSVELYDVNINPLKKDSLTLFKFPEGFELNQHVDTLSDESLHIASVYYINDDYTGGEISFKDHDLTIKPKANSLVIFPGNESYTHGVNKIFDNDRYSSALWFQFTGSTFSKKSEWYGNK